MLSHQSVNGSIFGKKEKEMGHTTRGLFDEHFRLEKISKQNDPLEKLRAHIDFEFYRKPLEDYFKKDISLKVEPCQKNSTTFLLRSAIELR